MNSLPQIVMIADDLSGAADCAVSCAVQGLSTVVALSEAPASQPTQVLAIDAATRSMPSERAAATIERIVAPFQSARPRVLFKKLDSLLRGHVGPELVAMRGSRNPAVIVMAPALPAQGRATIDGCVWLNRQRLDAADAPKMLTSAGLTAAAIDLALVRQAQQLAPKMAELARQHDALICDAETEEDLRSIAAAIVAMPHAGWDGSIIWAGSSGLARHIPSAMGIVGASDPIEEPRFRGPILLVVGSRTPLAREQVYEAGQIEGITTVSLTPETLRACRGSEIDNALASGNDVIAVIDASAEAAEDPYLCSALALLTSPHTDKVGALIATGGETARAVLTAWDITSLRLLREIEPGVPLAISAGARQIPVITKSGSFGNRATLAHCVKGLRGLKLE